MLASTTTEKSKKTRPVALPDERFWIKYSQNHELPLSVTSSVFVHVLAFGFVALILAGIFSGLFGKTGKPDVIPFSIAGGGKGGSGEIGADAEVANTNGAETAAKPAPTEPIKPLEPRNIQPPMPNSEPLVQPNGNTSRLAEETVLSNSRLGEIGRKANEALASVQAKQNVKEEKSAKGGSGGAVGTGNGPANGTGGNKISSEGEKRNLRWTMIFRTHSGNDYLKQLQELGATLAVPDGNGEFLVFRDLGKRPLTHRKEPAGSVSGIRWTDDRADSVPALARSLGLPNKPPYIMAFFKTSFEEELRRLEKQRFGGNEDLIEETTFRVVQKNGKYVPELEDLKLKR